MLHGVASLPILSTMQILRIIIINVIQNFFVFQVNEHQNVNKVSGTNELAGWLRYSEYVF